MKGARGGPWRRGRARRGQRAWSGEAGTIPSLLHVTSTHAHRTHTPPPLGQTLRYITHICRALACFCPPWLPAVPHSLTRGLFFRVPLCGVHCAAASRCRHLHACAAGHASHSAQMSAAKAARALAAVGGAAAGGAAAAAGTGAATRVGSCCYSTSTSKLVLVSFFVSKGVRGAVTAGAKEGQRTLCSCSGENGEGAQNGPGEGDSGTKGRRAERGGAPHTRCAGPFRTFQERVPRAEPFIQNIPLPWGTQPE